jgi:hypothetical protein
MTVKAAQKETTKAPARVLTEPKAPNPFDAPLPLATAPMMMNTQQMIAAVRNLTMWVPTAVPNILAASLAPSDHPIKSPLDRKMINSNPTTTST